MSKVKEPGRNIFKQYSAPGKKAFAIYIIVGIIGIAIVGIVDNVNLTVLFVLVIVFATLVYTSNNQHRVEDIHTLVNNRMSIVVSRVEQLTKALTDNGIAVPEPPRAEDMAQISEAIRVRNRNRHEGVTDA